MAGDSTRRKLEITFGCLVALLIGVGWLGLSRMGQIHSSLNQILDQEVEKLTLANQGVLYLNSNFRLVTTFVLLKHASPTDIQALVSKREENKVKILSAKRKMTELCDSAAEKELLNKIDQAGALSSRSVFEVVDLLRQPGKANEAQALMANTTIPLLNRHRDAWTSFMRYEEDQIKEARARSEKNYIATRSLSIALILVVVGLAIGIAALAMKQMSRDVKHREESKAAIRKLNEDLEKKVAERTEDLARTVAALQEEAEVRRAQEVDIRRLAAIVEYSDDAIIAAGLDSVVTDWNRGAERMFGYARNEMIGKSLSVLIPEDLYHEHVSNREKLLSGENVVRRESVRKKKNGELVHVAIAISPLKDQDGRIVGDSAIVRDMTERRLIEDAHRRSEASYRSFVENAPFGILRTTLEGRIVQANPALVEMLGYDSEQEVLRLNMGTDVYRNPGEREEVTRWLLNQGTVQGMEVEWKQKTGRPFTIRSTAHVAKDTNGNVEFLEGFVEDISERRALEQQLRQGQKMEAIGRLAGGIAHDFNNLLGVIIGYGDLLLEHAGGNNSMRNPAEQILKAADRASALTRQLLAFSRQQVLEMKVLNLNAVVADMGIMLQRLLGEDIHLETSLDPELGQVKADEGQIEQVIMNLAVNARDAMPGGGRLRIETRNASIEEGSPVPRSRMEPGDYVTILVQDTGMGMDAATQAHIFEPFFTTKEQGKGTGLGLATVYGVVKQSGGYVWVDSEPGAGSTFTIYLPMFRQKAEHPGASEAMPAPGRGAGTILVVEDEESLRTLTRSILEHSGYTVLEASNGMEAVDIAGRHTGPIDLLLTDMVMPGMNGRAVAEKVTRLHPDVRIAYMSGYTGFTQREAASFNAVMIAKPFTRNTLLQRVSEALELEQKPS